MKFVLLGFVLLFALILPGSADGAEETYRVIPLTAGIKEGLQGNDIWRACGEYFMAADRAGEKVVLISYEMGSPDIYPVFDFYRIGNIVTRIDDKLPAPIIVTGGREIKIWMNGQDFRASLPCLARGSSI